MLFTFLDFCVVADVTFTSLVRKGRSCVALTLTPLSGWGQHDDQPIGPSPVVRVVYLREV